MSFAKETRDLLIECCVEFITMLSSEANEIAEKDAKKTIACEHITKALEDLGFGEYIPSLHDVAESFKTSQVVCIRFRETLQAAIGHAMYNRSVCQSADRGADARKETDQDRAVGHDERRTHPSPRRTIPERWREIQHSAVADRRLAMAN